MLEYLLCKASESNSLLVTPEPKAVSISNPKAVFLGSVDKPPKFFKALEARAGFDANTAKLPANSAIALGAEASAD